MFFCVDQAGCNPETPADDVQIMHYLPMATFGEEFSKGVAPRVLQQLRTGVQTMFLVLGEAEGCQMNTN